MDGKRCLTEAGPEPRKNSWAWATCPGSAYFSLHDAMESARIVCARRSACLGRAALTLAVGVPDGSEIARAVSGVGVVASDDPDRRRFVAMSGWGDTVFRFGCA